MMRPVIYQLFVRHFSNDKIDGIPWGRKEQNGCGTFNGVTNEALDGLVAMGVTHLWLTGVIRHATCTNYPDLPAQPESIVKGLAGSPYAIVDYYDVDPDLAENPLLRMEEFEDLLARCHRKGLVPLIDFVGNHVSRGYESRHGDHDGFGDHDDTSCFYHPDNSFFYLQYGIGEGNPPFRLPSGEWKKELFMARVTGNNAVTWQPSRYDWYETVKLNFGFNFLDGPGAARNLPGIMAAGNQVPGTWRSMDEILAFWQAKGVGGFRCDMAHMVPMPFWKWAIARARVRDRGVFFIAEAYDDHMKTTEGDPMPDLLDCGFAAVYDAGMYHLATDIYQKGAWANDMDHLNKMGNMFMERGVRYLENHDEPRMSSPEHWGGKGRVVMPAVEAAVLGAGRGPVLIYNGQEVGEDAQGPSGYGGTDGRTSIFDYTCLPRLQKWLDHGRFDVEKLPEEDRRLREFHVKFLNLLKHPAMAEGDFYGLNWANMQTPGYGREKGEKVSGHWVYSYLKHDRASGRSVLVVANLSPHKNFPDLRVSIPENALTWCGKAGGGYVRFTDLLEEETPAIEVSVRELLEPGIRVPLDSGQVCAMELTCDGEGISPTKNSIP